VASKFEDIMLKKYNMVRDNLKGYTKITSIIEQLKMLEAERLAIKKKFKDKVARINRLITELNQIVERETLGLDKISDSIELNKKQLEITNCKNKIKSYKKSKDEVVSILNTTSLECAEIRRDVQRITYLSIIDKVLNLNFPIYTAHYYDFRGRMYPKSTISFMYFKAIRAFFKTSHTTPNYDNIRKSNYYNKILMQKVFLSTEFELMGLNDIDRYFLNVVFLELGKLRKKFITGLGLELKDFVSEGIRLFYEGDEGVDIDDCGYVYQLKNCLNNFIKNRDWLGVTIIRDSTASSFQH
jgi:hypothetical protein